MLRTVHWLIPLDSQNTDLLLVTACDTRYLKYAISLIKSVDLFSPGYRFLLHVVNPDESAKEHIFHLSDLLQSTSLAVSYEDTDLSSLEEEQKRAYFASARFFLLADLLKYYENPVFWLDADSLIVNPIDLNFSDKTDAEIVLVRRDKEGNQKENLAVLTASIWAKPTKNVAIFFQRLADNIEREVQNGTIKWYVDQISFYQQMKTMEKEIKFYNLKKKYSDWDFNDTSIVWSGKGIRKEDSIRFFLLQGELSKKSNGTRIYKDLLNFLIQENSDLTKSPWMQSRIKSASAETIRPEQPKGSNVNLFLPRLDLPWKKSGVSKHHTLSPSDDVKDLRQHWKEFTSHLANAIEKASITVKVIELPAWEINRETVEASPASLSIIPHRCYLDFDDGSTPVLFYMQEYFRSVFVLDEKGWSAASSKYPFDLKTMQNATGYNAFDEYRRRLQAGELGSKFAQTPQKGLSELISGGDIPVLWNWFFLPKKKRPYIFFPLQIPHDQSIEYFSDISELSVIQALTKWAKASGNAVVLKPHPANRKAMKQFESFVDNKTVFWSEAHVYDLIEHASAVYTINSGVGFESLLHMKPVVTFGRAEYDCVTFQATTDTLDKAWDYCSNIERAELEKKYRRFIDWFLSSYAVDLSQPKTAANRLGQIVTDIILRIKKDTHNAS